MNEKTSADEQRKNYRFEFGFKSRRERIIRTQLEREQADQIVDLIHRSFHQESGGILKLPKGKSTIHFIRLSEVESVVYEVYK